MTTLYIGIVSTYISNFLARISYEKQYRRLAIFWSGLTAAILVSVAGLRNGIGDTSAYMEGYSRMAANPPKFTFEGEFGFKLLQLILIQISSNPQIFIFTVALITHLLNTISFAKYKTYLELQVYLYITSGYYIISMNGMRQCLAAAILLMCTKFILEGKFKHFLTCVLIISSIHKSIFIMIPIYFIVRQEAWSKRVIQLMVVSLIGVLFYNQLSTILFKAIEDTKYGVYTEYVFGGSSFTRTIVNAVPVILAYLKRNEIKEKWPEGNIFVNLSLINLVFVSFSMANMIFNRFTLYFQLYNFILIPFIIKNCLKGKEKRLVYFALIICYFIFFYYEQAIGMNLKYTSDYLKLSNILY